MFSAFSEDLDKQFRGSVDDSGMAVEIRIGVYKAIQGNDLLYRIERADGLLDYRESVQDNDARGFNRLLDRAYGWDFPEDLHVPIDRESSGKEE